MFHSYLDRINSFPEGYKTVVGERGLKLSGGEKVKTNWREKKKLYNNFSNFSNV